MIFVYTGACQASAPSQFGWTADGTMFVTACTFPRMRQGNGFEVRLTLPLTTYLLTTTKYLPP